MPTANSIPTPNWATPTGKYYYTPDDWYDELFGSGNLRQEYNVSIAGASERLDYYLRPVTSTIRASSRIRASPVIRPV